MCGKWLSHSKLVLERSACVHKLVRVSQLKASKSRVCMANRELIWENVMLILHCSAFVQCFIAFVSKSACTLLPAKVIHSTSLQFVLHLRSKTKWWLHPSQGNVQGPYWVVLVITTSQISSLSPGKKTIAMTDRDTSAKCVWELSEQSMTKERKNSQQLSDDKISWQMIWAYGKEQKTNLVHTCWTTYACKVLKLVLNS